MGLIRRLIPSILCLLPLVAAAGESHAVSYYASPNGGAYGAGAVFRIANHQRTVIYDFCPEPVPNMGCTDGANPLANPIVMPDGSILGATTAGGNPGYGPGVPGGGVLYRLEPRADGTWVQSVIYTFCPYFARCDAYGSPVGTITLTAPDTVEGLIEGPGGEKGLHWRFHLGDRQFWEPVQRWTR